MWKLLWPWNQEGSLPRVNNYTEQRSILQERRLIFSRKNLDSINSVKYIASYVDDSENLLQTFNHNMLHVIFCNLVRSTIAVVLLLCCCCVAVVKKGLLWVCCGFVVGLL